MNKTMLAIVSVASMLIAGGCRTPEPESPDAKLAQPIHPPVMPDLGRGPGTIEIDEYSMYISPSVTSRCKGPAPFFAFASAKPTARDHATLQILANCMNDGPLKDKSIMLIGHTDPRGTDGYNEKLGLARAEKVRNYLIGHGVDGGRVLTSSLGKEDASASPKEWPSDRRVEVRVVE